LVMHGSLKTLRNNEGFIVAEEHSAKFRLIK